MSSISRWYLDAQHSFSFKRYTKFVLYIIINIFSCHKSNFSLQLSYLER